MKSTELTVGLEVAVVDGTSKYDRDPAKATKAKIIGEPHGGHVRIEFLEDGNSRIGFPRMRDQKGKKGDTFNVETRKVWKPWSQIAVIAKEEREREEAKERERQECEEKLAALQERLDRAAGNADDGPLRWHRAGYGYNRRVVDDYIVIPTEALEALLRAAER